MVFLEYFYGMELCNSAKNRDALVGSVSDLYPMEKRKVGSCRLYDTPSTSSDVLFNHFVQNVGATQSF